MTLVRVPHDPNSTFLRFVLQPPPKRTFRKNNNLGIIKKLQKPKTQPWTRQFMQLGGPQLERHLHTESWVNQPKFWVYLYWYLLHPVYTLHKCWWFGCLEHDFYFPFHIWDVILPIDELTRLAGVVPPGPRTSKWAPRAVSAASWSTWSPVLQCRGWMGMGWV